MKERPLHNSASLEKRGHFDEISSSSEPAYAGRPIGGERETKDRKIALFYKGDQLYRNNLKNREFGKEAPQNFQAKAVRSERPLPNRQGASEHENFEAKPTPPKTDSSGCFGICRGLKQLFTTTLVITSIVLTPALKADDPLTDETNTEPQTEEVQSEDGAASEGTPVSQAPNDSSRAAKKRQWQNIALAVGAVAVAVTAMILVANNDGHKK